MAKKLNTLVNKYRIFLFDFDGVVIDSETVRIDAFKQALKEFNKQLIDDFILYHKENGGLSRYVKFERFKNITNSSETELSIWLKRYNHFCKTKMVNDQLLISETIGVIKKLKQKGLVTYLVSASDQSELQYLAEALNLRKYFKEIVGSPTEKSENIANILIKEKLNGYSKEDFIMIGDSINDYDAAKKNSIDFFGFGNELIKTKTSLTNAVP